MIEFPPPDPELAPLARRNLIYNVTDDEAGERLDRYTAQMSGLSRGKIRALIDFGSVWVRGKVCRRQSRILKTGDWVTLQAPMYGPVPFYEADESRILFRDKWLIAYDKESGIPCQQTPYDGYNHVYGALERLLKTPYLGLHHRLDSPTSGVMLFTLNKKANQGMSLMFVKGTIQKTYLLVVPGNVEKDSFTVEAPIAKTKGAYHVPPDGKGKPARTDFTVIHRGASHTLLQAWPRTGRTHQIRLHMTHINHPILGDSFYSGAPHNRLMLHAESLYFNHPVTHETMEIKAPPPSEFLPYKQE
jgi:23S rRNA pseudouridine1911/1915/1917 synthase